MADEIPISASEQAFLDAMDVAHQDQEQDAAPLPTNGHAETDAQNSKSSDSDNERDTASGSARGSAEPLNQAVTAASPTSTLEASSTAPQTENVTPVATAVALPVGDQSKSGTPAPVPTQSIRADIAKATPPKRKKRLPQDVVGQFEDRIEDDPRGDTDAWLGLIDEHKRKGKFDDARIAYARFFEAFPQAAHQWLEWINMELVNNEFPRVESVFSKCLMNVPHIELWSAYLDYIRRRNNLNDDPTGKLRSIVSAAFEFVIANIGHDREAGQIWRDYIEFVKGAPGVVGGTSWVDQQKMDSLRKAYQRAITQPVTGVEALWKEYDAFEHGLNKMTARKFLQERSPAFMTARSCLIELNNLTRGLRKDTLPRLPPASGCEGEEDWNFQLSLWKKWVKWEKDDPLVLASEDANGLQKRILYSYKQALITMRFCPEIWYDATEYCLSIDQQDKAVEFLRNGLQANPESCLLTFKLAERLETTLSLEDGDAAAIRNGQIVRRPFDELLNHLYAFFPKREVEEAAELEKIEEHSKDKSRSASPESRRNSYDSDSDDDEDKVVSSKRAEKQKKIAEVKERYKNEHHRHCKVISAIWIALMRAMRRIQGHGKVNDPLAGSRGIFAEARKRGKITSDVYVASALVEYHCYQDPAALRIFERAVKLFPTDEELALAYLKHLVQINDITNARAVFEMFVTRATPDKCRRIYRLFCDHEAQYGELAQVQKLEKRMAELYPSDPKLELFAARYRYHDIDPSRYLPIISPAKQCRPKAANFTTTIPLQGPPPPGLPLPIPLPGAIPGTFSGLPPPPPPPPIQQHPPAPAASNRISSPKRAAEDHEDSFAARARKLPRSDSPLKGAAGRRLNQLKQQGKQNRNAGGRDSPSSSSNQPPPSTLPDSIMYLLSMLPPARRYDAVIFKPEEMVRVIAQTYIPTPQDFLNTHYQQQQQPQ